MIPWAEYQEIGTGQLGYSPEEFWSMSLPEFLAAHRGYQNKQRDVYWHTGHIVAALRNVNGGIHGQAVSADDIFPFLLTPEQQHQKEWSHLESRLLPDEDDE